MQWQNTLDYPYEPNRFLLGYDEIKGEKFQVGLKTERHAITIAGAGSGKGVSVIIPNLLSWENNALIIDPKGEAAEATAETREKMGQSVYVVDPFKTANIKPSLLASYNPLDILDLNSDTIKEDITAITDGIVMRGHDAGSSHWDDGAQAVISGIIAYVLLHEKVEQKDKNLLTVRDIIRDQGLFWDVMERCKTIRGCAGVAQAGAARAFAKEGEYFVSNAEKNTSWLDSKAMRRTLETSSFALSELKTGNATVFLVLPANYLVQHGRFLRLFVRCSIEEMQRRTPSGALREKQCLFLLDEFFALGFIEEISVSAGLMRGYGLQLWVVLQDLGQLIKLYGREGSETFFANSDLHQFFGNTDRMTLDYMSRSSGVVTDEEIEAPPEPFLMAGSSKAGQMLGQIHQHKMTEYQRKMSSLGRPHLSADELAKLVQKKEGVTADKMYCVVNGTDKLLVTPAPYFEKMGFTNELDGLKEVRNQEAVQAKNGSDETTNAILLAPVFLFVGLLAWLWFSMEENYTASAAAFMALCAMVAVGVVINWGKMAEVIKVMILAGVGAGLAHYFGLL